MIRIVDPGIPLFSETITYVADRRTLTFFDLPFFGNFMKLQLFWHWLLVKRDNDLAPDWLLLEQMVHNGPKFDSFSVWEP